jgi:hypothetical protein
MKYFVPLSESYRNGLYCQKCQEYLLPSPFRSPHVKHHNIQLCIRTTAVSVSVNSVREGAPTPFPQQEPNYFFWQDVSVEIQTCALISDQQHWKVSALHRSIQIKRHPLFIYLIFHLSFDGFLSRLNTPMC